MVTMAKRIIWLCIFLLFGFIFAIIADNVTDSRDYQKKLSIDENTKYVIIDTDMGADDA